MDEAMSIAIRIGIAGVAAVGGSLFAFSTFVMPALKRLPYAEGIRAMQQINLTVFTPWFMAPFFGTAILALVGSAVALLNSDSPWSSMLLASSTLYVAGVFIVTAFGNVPLNNQLASAEADDQTSQELWRGYLITWTRLNHVRVASAFGALLCLAESLHRMGGHG